MFSAQRSVPAHIFQISPRRRPHERTPTMPSRTDDAKRALVKLLRSLGEDFGCRVTVTRDSPGHDVHRALRAVARKVHPDKPGGSQEMFQRLSAAHDAWSDLDKTQRTAGRPPAARECPADVVSAPPAGVIAPLYARPQPGKKEFRVNAQAVLLTYQGIGAARPSAMGSWPRFIAFVHANLRTWRAKHWTATLETMVGAGLRSPSTYLFYGLISR